MQFGSLVGFGLRNFKSFYYLNDIDIRPLTVLVGANSAGKSSLLQSLLLLKQSLRVERSSNNLRFEGYWTQLGSFNSVISDFDVKRPLEFRFLLDFLIEGNQLEEYFNHMHFDEEAIRTSHLAYSYIGMTFGIEPDTNDAILQELSTTTFIPKLMSAEEAISLKVDGEGNILGQNNLPAMPLLSRKRTSVTSSIEMDGMWPFRFNLMPQNTNKKRLNNLFFVPFSYVSALATPLELLEHILSERLEYVGPLRADPRPFYPVSVSPHIGLRGEATVPYLLRHREDVIHYKPDLSGEVCEATLLDATNHWLQRMKVTPKLTINPVESIAYVAAVESSSVAEKSINLAQVGFGVSQVLPVLVSGLNEPDNSILLLEQPEIHLHPRLQGELAEFLLCVAQIGKTVIVETHSDHLINRLRRCIAEDKTGTLSSMVNILFVHSGTQDNPSSYIEELEIDELGNITNWPPDFLSEAANESLAILRAGQHKALAARP